MRKKLSALLALLLALTLLFAACAAPGGYGGPDTEDLTSEDYDLTIVSDLPTDNTPADVNTTSPPEETGTATQTPTETDAPPADTPINEDGVYTSKEDVALYIHTYGRLPSNFITKKEAQALGWTGGSLEPYAPGKCIGGAYFGNYEGLLPTKRGRTYTECDIDTLGKSSRGAKRIVFSNDGLIYYSDDHYESFTLLYGEE